MDSVVVDITNLDKPDNKTKSRRQIPTIKIGQNHDSSNGTPVVSGRNGLNISGGGSPKNILGVSGAKTVRRRGNSYVINNLLLEDDSEITTEADIVEHMIEDLYRDAVRMASSSNNIATIFKYIYITVTLFIIISGAVIGTLSAISTTQTSKTVTTILGFIITGVTAVMTTFSIEKRGVLLKEVSNKLRRLSRQVRTLEYLNLESHDKMMRLEDFYADMDDMDMSIYDNTMTRSYNNTKLIIQGNDETTIPDPSISVRTTSMKVKDKLRKDKKPQEVAVL